MIQLTPSLLAADSAHLADAILLCKDCGCDEVHFDVMDGHFVPNLTFGPHILADLSKAIPFVYDVHLMVTNPCLFVRPYAEAGADVITVHEEAKDAATALEAIHQAGLKSGISIRPKTPAEALLPYLPMADRVLLMTVEPGFGGQKLIMDVLPKARRLREMGFKGEIQADGGINKDNVALLAEAGIDILVMGTAFFRSEQPRELCSAVHGLFAPN